MSEPADGILRAAGANAHLAGLAGVFTAAAKAAADHETYLIRAHAIGTSRERADLMLQSIVERIANGAMVGDRYEIAWQYLLEEDTELGRLAEARIHGDARGIVASLQRLIARQCATMAPPIAEVELTRAEVEEIKRTVGYVTEDGPLIVLGLLGVTVKLVNEPQGEQA